ncbi:MAG TPA: MSEP-CTERM sorting domain-containing protein [Chitinophagaceae bacterium]|nr:MSEP-CTERM sorting domain-containing protein [Chitinophagaceae bacterium]
MRNLLNPKWLLIVNTLPTVLLFSLFLSQFNIIKTLLDENDIQLWKFFGYTLGMLGIINLAYSVYLTIKKQYVSVWYSVIALVCYITLIYLHGYHSDKLIPASVPQWMISGNLFLYVGTFLMPTLVYALFVLVAYFTPNSKTHKAWVNFLIAIGVPVAGYLFSQIILPLWQRVESDFFIHALVILVIVATLVFLFFLVRGVFILATKKAAVWQKYQLAWKIPIAIVFPLLGLSVNNGHLFDQFSAGNSGIFGDFNDPRFYILAVVNGVLLCLPNLDNKTYRLLLFIGRTITFAFTLYFFLVFLPFLPLSVIAIIAIGIGFLMLTPLLLFVIHSYELVKDYSFLKSLFTKRLLIGILILGFLIIPTLITVTYLNDKSVLARTLAYVYSPDYSKQVNIDKSSLQKTLNVIKYHKNQNRDVIFSNIQIPYLSAFFKWLVLDNLILSDVKINTIEKIFFGNPSFKLQAENIQNENVRITKFSTKSVYNQSQKSWTSWLDLEITNQSGENRFAEYATTIDLPEGCWISDYYLFVGNKKEHGILAEKKSAMWIYAQILNENRDPGILYYLTGNKVAFRVFPFTKNEVRKTGIEFLHKGPLQLTIDNKLIQFGNKEEILDETIETENVAYVSADQKKTLKPVQRKPYFHFLVDISQNKKSHTADFINRIDKLLASHKALAENTQISFINSAVDTIPPNSDWKQKYQSQIFEGGCYLERAISTTLFNAHKNKSRPVIVVVTDSIQNAVLDKDFSDFKFAFPESDLFFDLGRDGLLGAHSLINNPLKQLPDSMPYSFDQTVLEYKTSDNSIAYLPNNNMSSIILKKDVFEVSREAIGEKNWRSALTMQGKWKSQILHPETADKNWLSLVKYSFLSKVMTPVTSYLVVENEAQKAMLKKKQEQVLRGNKSLELGEDTQRMSEPDLILLTFLLGLILWFKQKRKYGW